MGATCIASLGVDGAVALASSGRMDSRHRAAWSDRRLARHPGGDTFSGRPVPSRRGAAGERRRRCLGGVTADPDPGRTGRGARWAAGVDASAAAHRAACVTVFADAGFDPDRGEVLRALESDAALNPFADDVADSRASIKRSGLRIAILSDSHFDLRPAFAPAGLVDIVDACVRSWDRGLRRPNPACLAGCLRDLDLDAAQTCIVGVRATHDGAAVHVGCPVLPLPALRATSGRRHHPVTAPLTDSKAPLPIVDRPHPGRNGTGWG